MNAVIYRVPRRISIITPRSSCTKCKKLIHWYENIPLISFLLLKGKCSKCKTLISISYPLIELTCGVVAFLLVPQRVTSEALIYFVFYFGTFAVLLAQFLIDLEHKLLPDSINIVLVLLILPVTIINQKWNFWLLGGLLGFGFPFVVTWFFYLLKGKVGLGGGDIKLFGILGLYLGVKGIFLNLFLSCMLGSVIGLSLIYFLKRDKKEPIPFGPFIIFVAVIQIYFPSYFREFSRHFLGF
ncbi:MAG: prepilin peptidase [Bacteriovoracaceae bacterium]|nr:prepilin peptidase [Bacteriovoracaceae bacterium]